MFSRSLTSLLILGSLFSLGRLATPPASAGAPDAGTSHPTIAMILAEATQVAAGQNHTCALTIAGDVKCWGLNDTGQLGDGTTIDRDAPVAVLGLGAAVTAITAGSAHTCALTVAGGVKCWGLNSAGQLGDGTTTNSSAPVDVSGLSDVTSVEAGGSHTCAVSGGGAKCWGANYYGQLGDSALTDRNAPVEVSGLGSGVQKVTAGGAHTCALTTGGGVKCWGYNRDGQLGDGSFYLRKPTPSDVSGLAAGVTDVKAGSSHTCAVSNGGVKCWGANYYGQLGDGTTTGQHVPVDVSGLSGVTALAPGQSEHTCALTSAGGVKCWGSNYYGQLGAGGATPPSTPVDAAAALRSGVTSIADGYFHSCAVARGRVMCWGNNYIGQLGNGVPAAYPSPVSVSALGRGVSAMAAGGNHTCALLSGGALECWGNNSHGQLGDGTTVSRDTPARVTGLESGVTGVTAGQNHTCALTSSGGVKCWGSNYAGQLGDGTIVDRHEPVDVLGLTAGVRSVAAGRSHTCAITTAGGLKCWGDNGMLGNGTNQGSSAPVDVLGLSSGVATVAPGYYHTCALTTAGGVKCWGAGGLTGDGTTGEHLAPVDVSGLTSGVTAIAAGGIMTGHTCALLTGGGVKCWGTNWYGQLGDGTTEGRYAPVDVLGLGSPTTAITAGGGHTCALVASGAVQCWGLNSYGQVGDGTSTNRALPVDVDGLAKSAVAITAGGSDIWGVVSQGSAFTGHTCAVLSDGAVQCWGGNSFGQLGVRASWWPAPVPGFGPAAASTSFLPVTFR